MLLLLLLLQVFSNFTYSQENGIDYENNYIYLNEEEKIATECVRNCYRFSIAPFCNTLCNHYGNFYVCNGKQNKVLRVSATGARQDDAQILHKMRSVLKSFNANVGTK